MPRRILRALANSQTGLRARFLTGLYPPAYPFVPDLEEVVSDLFLWRNDALWETGFDLFHVAGLVNPQLRRPYEVLIRLHDSSGAVIGVHLREVRFGEVQSLSLRELLGGRVGYGTFCVFHLVGRREVFGEQRTCLTERGYVSYRRRQDSLRSYVHGNLYAAGCHPVTRRIRNLGAVSRFEQAYRPQVRLDDCLFAEVALSNFTTRPIRVSVEPVGKKSAGRGFSLPPSGSLVLDTRDALRGWPLVILRSRAAFLRPLIFKHYATHFDPMHG